MTIERSVELGLQCPEGSVTRELAVRVQELEESETILRWIEAGFPPWGCHHCRGAEYGPDGVPCPACNGASQEIEPPPRAQAIYERVERVLR